MTTSTPFDPGDRVWWWHLPRLERRGKIVSVGAHLVGVRDDDSELIYLDPQHLHKELIPPEDGIYTGITDIAYHSDRGSLSSSGARALLAPSCPAMFRHAQRETRKPKRYYDIGHLAHRLVLGEGSEIAVLDPAVHGLKKDGAEADNPRATATWKQADAEARARGEVPVHIDDYRTAEAMAAKVREHPVAAALFEADGQAELSGYWHDSESGVRLRVRPDWLCELGGRVFAVDYKTSTSAHPGHFAKSAAEWGYHVQQAWYVDGLAAHGIDADFLFVCQSKTPPFLVSVMRIDPAAVDLGRRRNRQAINLYAQCSADDHWPGYGDTIHTVSLPSYITYQQEQEIAA
jgi:hypothetical protein